MRSTFQRCREQDRSRVALVFLSCMKELPITILLSPIGFETLALNVWSYSNEAMFAEAAPFAIAILLFSSLFVGILFSRMDPIMSTLLRVNGLTKRFESQSPDVVSEVSFTVEPNEIFAILGPSGCGKTTTLRLMAGVRASGQRLC